MPNRSSSSSPEVRKKSKKHRHKSRSPDQGRHTVRKEDVRHTRKDDRGHRHRRHSSSPEYDERRPIKEEPREDPEPRFIKPEPPERHRDRAERGDRRNREEHRSRSRHDDRDHGDSFRQERERNNERRREARKGRPNNPFAGDSGNSSKQQWGKPSTETEAEPDPQDKDKPNFELSGKLTEDTNTFKGVVIKYNEPPEARKPKKKWRLYPFKGDSVMPVLHLHRQSAYLLGRERKVADIPIDHPSCSKQHAVFQFRLVPFEREDGTKGRRVSPYIIDLNSANGTFVNNSRIDGQRYVELMEKDVVKFGFSSREYVLLHGSSDTSELVGDDLGED